jgi:uncharacterized protein (DUF1501 family)
VKGGDIYGTFPRYGRTDGNGNFSSDDQITDGSLLPTLAVDQYAATLGAWMGLSDAELQDVLPNLHKFGASDLGFMRS